MTDGRVYTSEDEIDVLHEDLGRARRQVTDLENAPREGRVTDTIEWDDNLANARRRVQTLEHQLREALAEQRAAEEAYER